jgi:O-antigen/teichoic acid export membrane protein
MSEPASATPEAQAAGPGGTADAPGFSLRFLLSSAAALVSTTAVTSGVGFIYWAAAAQFFPATQVGASATAISAMTVLATVATLGFGTLLMARLPTMQVQRVELMVTTALVSAASGSLLALIAALTLPHSFLGLEGVGSTAPATLLFAAGAGAAAAGFVVDQGLLSLLGGGPQLGRNLALAIVKLAFLVVFALGLAGSGGMSVYGSWLIGNLLSVAGLAAWATRRFGVRLHRFRPRPGLLRGMRRDAAQHHALNLALQLPYYAMPIVASVVLGASQAGYLYATWSVAGFVLILPMALSTSLFASGARESLGFSARLRFTLRSSFLACLAANVLLLPSGGLVLRLFGSDYESSGRLALVLVCLGALPLIVKDHHVSIARVLDRVGREAALVWGMALAELGLAVLGAHLGGLTGLATGWLCAVVLEGILLLPLVLRVRSGRFGTPPARDGSASAMDAGAVPAATALPTGGAPDAQPSR